MRSQLPKYAFHVGVPALALLAAACGGGGTDDVECGEGTELRDGVCVNIKEATVSCDEGTELDPETAECKSVVACAEGTQLNPAGECVPVAECGPGTTLDLTTGLCAPEAGCGAGTTLDANGQCVSSVSCGAGTTHNAATGECEPVFPCEDGTELNDATGRCESGLECGPNQVESGGQCVGTNAGLIAEADAIESTTDLNDPAYGGTPEALTLEPVGERTVFTGTIGRPVDLDGDGKEDQDVDVWRFSGQAGQYLRVRVLSTGLPQPTYVVRGPQGYYREAPMGWAAEADRHLVLPYDGDYDIYVMPTLWQIAGLQLGGPLASYVGVIEQLPLATPIAVVPGDFATPGQLAGTFTNSPSGIFSLQAAARTPMLIDFATVKAGWAPALLVFRNDMTLISDTVLDLSEGSWAGVLGDAAGDLIVVADWVRGTTPDDAFDINVATMPLVEMGTIPGDASITSAAADIAGNEAAAYAFATPADILLNGTFSLSGPDLQFSFDGGFRFYDWDKTSFMTLSEAGEYVVFCYKDSGATVSSVTLTINTLVPHNLGTLTLEGSPNTVSGPEIHVWNQWAMAKANFAGYLGTSMTAEYATDPEVTAYTSSGVPIHFVDRLHLNRTMVVEVQPGDKILYEIKSTSGNITNWTFTAEALPPAVDLDHEPNSLIADAVTVDTIPTSLRGWVTADDPVDVYKIVLDTPLEPEEALEIRLDNPTETSSFGTAFLIRFYDETGAPIAFLDKPVTGDFTGARGQNITTYIPASEGPGPFFMEIECQSTSCDDPYRVALQVVTQATEVEPNDDPASATPIPSLPATIYALVGDQDTADYYQFTLTDPVVNGASLRISAWNAETNNPFPLRLEDSDNNEIVSTNAVYNNLKVTDLAAGTYYVSVPQTTVSTAPAYYLFITLDGPIEVEPNDNAATAMSLGELSDSNPLLTIDGSAVSTNDDVFTFTLDAPLGANEGLLIRSLNLNDATNVQVRLYEGLDPATGMELSFDSNYVNWIYNSPVGTQFSLLVKGGATSADLYRLWIEKGPAAETEPNNTQATAGMLGNLPAIVYGNASSTDTDVYFLNLSQDLGPSKALRATARNLVDSTRMTVRLLASDFTTSLANADATVATIESPPGLTAGSYYFVVGQGNGSSTTTDHYALSVEVIDVP